MKIPVQIIVLLHHWSLSLYGVTWERAHKPDGSVVHDPFLHGMDSTTNSQLSVMWQCFAIPTPPLWQYYMAIVQAPHPLTLLCMAPKFHGCLASCGKVGSAPIFPSVKRVSAKTWQIFMFADSNWFLWLMAITTDQLRYYAWNKNLSLPGFCTNFEQCINFKFRLKILIFLRSRKKCVSFKFLLCLYSRQFWGDFLPNRVQVISCSYFSQSALRKGCPNRNPFWCIQSIISFVILDETSWNFVIMFGYENYSSDKNMESI
jgi:hypothetical protein